MEAPHTPTKPLVSLALLCLPVLAFAGFALYAERRPAQPDVATLLIGEWKVQNSREPWMQSLNFYNKATDLTSYVLFKPDGTYESMSWDSAFSKAPMRAVEKGSYRVSGQTVTLHNFKQFARPHHRDEGLDVDATSTPCSDSINCAGE